MYNEKVLKHFQNPLNNGELRDANAVGQAVNPVCGDMIRVFLRIEGGVIREAAFAGMGCGGAIASGSVLTELLQGKAVESARRLKGADVSQALGGLPSIKLHCPDLAAEALQAALKDFDRRAAGAPAPKASRKT